MDWIPLISQCKSLVQSICGDNEGALVTQVNFSQQCPVVSQVRSLVESTLGDFDAASKTQAKQLELINSIADGIPILGHVKGTIHYAYGDHLGGEKAVISSSRTTGVIIGSAAGFAVAGPVGAACGAVAGGLVTDGVTTSVNSSIKQEFTPSGHIAAVLEIVEKVESNENISGNVFDMIGCVGLEAYGGYNYGSTKLSIADESALNRYLNGEGNLTFEEAAKIMNKISRRPGVRSKRQKNEHMTTDNEICQEISKIEETEVEIITPEQDLLCFDIICDSSVATDLIDTSMESDSTSISDDSFDRKHGKKIINTGIETLQTYDI